MRLRRSQRTDSERVRWLLSANEAHFRNLRPRVRVVSNLCTPNLFEMWWSYVELLAKKFFHIFNWKLNSMRLNYANICDEHCIHEILSWTLGPPFCNRYDIFIFSSLQSITIWIQSGAKFRYCVHDRLLLKMKRNRLSVGFMKNEECAYSWNMSDVQRLVRMNFLSYDLGTFITKVIEIRIIISMMEERLQWGWRGSVVVTALINFSQQWRCS